jgi:hypothetical protein
LQTASLPVITSADQKVTIPKETLEKALQTAARSQISYDYYSAHLKSVFLSMSAIVGKDSTGEFNILSPEAQREFANRVERAIPDKNLT